MVKTEVPIMIAIDKDTDKKLAYKACRIYDTNGNSLGFGQMKINETDNLVAFKVQIDIKKMVSHIKKEMSNG